MRVDLASGHYIDIVPLGGLKARHRDAHDGAPKIYIQFDDAGNPQMSGVPISASIATLQRDGLLSTLISGWSFTDDPDGGTSGQPLPLPHWTGEEIENHASIGDIPLDDFYEIEAILQPYLEKVRRRPDPKETTTGASTGTSRGRAGSRKG